LHFKEMMIMLAFLDFDSALSLKQQSAGRHVVPLGHVILITSQTVYSYSLILHAAITNFIVFDLTRPEYTTLWRHYTAMQLKIKSHIYLLIFV
jgi:hypothetical protein